MTKTKLIYICGMGHNGSTALELLLDQSNTTVGTSQLNDFLVLYDPAEQDNNRPPFVNDFWSEIASELSLSERESLETVSAGVLREKSLLPFVFSKRRRLRHAKPNGLVINAIARKHPDKTIIDSSKNISRLLGLLELEDVEIYVLHLTRDVRGYVESHNKRRRETNNRPRYLAPTLVWFAKNAAASLFVRPRSKNYLHIRYEQMMLAPEQFLKQLSEFTGENFDSCLPTLMGESPLKPAASLGFLGNRVLQQREEVFLDSKRIRNDGLFLSRIYWRLLGWLSSFWGYRFKPRS